MSRLYDKIFARGLLSSHGRNEAHLTRSRLEGTPVVAADDLSAYAFPLAGGGPNDWELLRDVPSVAPPLERIFIETRRPPETGEAFERYLHLAGEHISSWGALFEYQDLTAQYAERGFPDPARAACEHATAFYAKLGSANEDEAHGADSLLETKPGQGVGGVGEGDVRWLLQSVVFIELAGRKRILCSSFGLHGVVTTTGNFAPTADGGAALKFYGHPGALAPEGQLPKGLTRADIIGTMAAHTKTLYLPLLLAVAFMGCDGVKLRPQHPPEKLSKKHAKKHQTPLTPYWALITGAAQQLLDEEGSARELGLKEALHLTKPHFEPAPPKEEEPSAVFERVRLCHGRRT